MVGGTVIPRIFHHVWTSGDALPERVEAARKTWIDRHPGWEFRLWRVEDLDWLRNRSLFERAETFAQKADIARYEVLHRFGGVYLDTDMECLRPIDELVDGREFFAARQYDGIVAIGIFGGVLAHPIFREAIDRIPASCYFHRRDPIYVQTGPALLDRIVKEGHWEDRPDVHIFPSGYFYPYPAGEPWARSGPFPRAYAVHHWDRSWKDGAGLRPTLREVLVRPGRPASPSLAAVLREGRSRSREMVRRHLAGGKQAELRAKVAVVRTLRRFLPPAPQVIHGLPWGTGEVLVATPFGTRLVCPTEDLSIAPELALTGVYDPSFVAFLRRRLQPGMTFVDVGANVGLFTILAGVRVGPGGHVFAFECNPELVRFLARNVELNGYQDRIRVIAKAAHRDDERRTLHVPRDQKMLGSLTRFVGEEGSPRDVEEFPVECERLDVALRDVPFVDLLKIDVEGGEAAVIDGAAGLLDDGRLGAISLEYRENALREELRDEMEKVLTSLVGDRGATMHVPGDPRVIPLDEVLTVFEYPQLLVRFRNSTIGP